MIKESGSKRARLYVRKHLDSLGLKEHRGLDFENVAETILQDSYHIQSEQIDPETKSQGTQPLEINLTVRVWTKPKAGDDPTDALEDNHDLFDSIMQRLLDERNLYADGVKDVLLDSYLPEAISSSNNQIIKGEIAIIVKFDLCYRDPSL